MLSNLGCIGIRKGGPRHKPGPDVDAGILTNMFQKHREAFRDFGFYEHISRSQACSGAGLVLAFELLDDLLEVCPTGDMPAKACKDAILALVIKKPDLNRSMYNSGIFAGQRCERLGVMLNHLRRLAREPTRFKQAAMVLNGEEVSKLTALVKKVQVTPDLSTAQGLASGQWTDDDATVLADEHGTTAAPRRRLLKKTASDVSVDSDGYPRILLRASSSSKGIEVDKDGFPAMLGFDDWSEDDPLSPPAKKMRAKGSSLEVDSEGYPLLLVSSTPRASPVSKESPASKASPRNPIAKSAPRNRHSSAGPHVQDAARKTWSKMWYKNLWSVGVRRAKGHENNNQSQIFSFCNKAWSKEDLMDLGAQCLDKLHSGEGEETVAEWVRLEVQKD